MVDQGFMEFFVIFCQKCHIFDTGYMKYFITKHKDFLSDDPKLMDIWDNRDKLVSKHSSEMKYIEIAGCIFPNEPDVNASPNERYYIIRSVEHSASECHKWTSCKPSDSRIATTQSTKFKFLDVQSMYAAGSSIEINKQIYVAYFTCSHKKQKTLTAAVDGTIGAGKMVKVKFINNHMKTEIWQ